MTLEEYNKQIETLENESNGIDREIRKLHIKSKEIEGEIARVSSIFANETAPFKVGNIVKFLQNSMGCVQDLIFCVENITAEHPYTNKPNIIWYKVEGHLLRKDGKTVSKGNRDYTCFHWNPETRIDRTNPSNRIWGEWEFIETIK